MENWKVIRDQMYARGFQPLPNSSGQDAFEGKIAVGNISVDLTVSIPNSCFLQLPKFKILNPDALPKKDLGHLATNNEICYADENSFLLDQYSPGASLSSVFEQVERTLREMLHGNTRQDILAELPYYWGGSSIHMIDHPNDDRCITLAFGNWDDGRVIKFGGTQAKQVEAWCSKTKAKYLSDGTISTFQYDADLHLPPRKIISLENAIEWAQLHFSSYEVEAALQQSNPEKPGLIIFGKNAILGFRAKPDALIKAAQKKGFRKATAKNLWFTRKATLEVDLLYGIDISQREIAARNQNQTAPFQDKKLAVIGCGTLGGYVARSLVQCGAGLENKLLLIDDDMLAAENLGRHILGSRFIGANKAEAMAAFLTEDFPSINVEAENRPAQEVWNRLKSYDLILDVTGDEQFSYALNHHVLSQKATGTNYPPVLYGMIFGNGTAAQSFLARYEANTPCFKCLKPDFSQDWRFSPLSPKYSETELAVRPCNQGSFVPFNVSASLGSASTILQHAVDALARPEHKNLRTTIFDADKAGKATNKSVSPSPKCPACKI